MDIAYRHDERLVKHCVVRLAYNYGAMTLCVFENGRCGRCGYETRFAELLRECRPPAVVSLAVADYPQPTIEDLYALKNNAFEVPLEAVLPPPQPSGPGTELKKLLAGWPFYITASPDCSCNRVAAEMDALGPDECEKPERINYVVEAMKANAADRGIPFVDAAGRFLVRRAIRNARRRAYGCNAT